MSHFHFSMYLCCIIQLLNMESLDTLLRCDCCLVLKAARDPSNYDVDKTREGARALLRTAVASSHAPLRTETLTSVYADLKGGAGQEGGCRVRDRKGPNTPNTTKSSFLRRFLFLENREEKLLRLELSLFTSTAGDVSL